MKNIIILLTFLWAITSYAVAPYGIKGQQQAATLYSNVHQFPNNQVTNIGGINALVETGNTNILSNPSFEHSTFSTSWTNSAGTFTQETSVLIDGKASAKLVLSAQTMSLTQSSTLYAAQFADNVQGLAMVRIKSDIALKVCSIQAGTVSTSNCVTTSTDSKWGLYKVPFILGATSNGISIASSGTVSGTVYIDDAFVGAVDLQSDIPASEMYGKVSMASDCTWARTSAGTFADFATDATCTQTTSGKITSVAGQPAIVLPAGSPAGDYHVSMTGSFGPTHGATTATTECEFRFTDGVTGYSLGTVTNVSNNSTVVSARVASLAGTITLNSPLTSATTYTVQGRTTQGSNVNESCRINNGNLIALQTNFSVMYFPKNPVSTYSASCGANCVDTFSALVTDGAATTTVSQENAEFITGNCTNPSAGVYVCTLNGFTVTPNCNATPAVGSVRIVKTDVASNTTLNISSFNDSGVVADSNFNIMCQKQGADFVATRNIVGSFNEVVTSPGISRPKVCRIMNGGASDTTSCTASPCTEYFDSCGTASACTRSSTGIYGCTWANGTWANSSYVSCSPDGGNARVVGIGGTKTDANGSLVSAGVYSINSAFTSVDSYFSLRCEGQAP